MACCLLCCTLCCKWVTGNLNCCQLFRALVTFFVTNGLVGAYLQLSSLASVWTSVWVSILISLCFTLLFHNSAHIRCACVVFLVQCFSMFGLLMLFLFGSWLAIRDMLEKILQVHELMLSAECIMETLVRGSTTIIKTGNPPDDFNFDILKLVLVGIHYSWVVPFLLIFLYSLCFEITFKHRESRQQEYDVELGDSRPKLSVKLHEFLNHFMSFIVGLVFSLTLTLFAFEFFFIRSTLLSMTIGKCQHEIEHIDRSFWFLIYLGYCFILLVISPFSDLITEQRRVIINACFDLEAETPTPRLDAPSVIKKKTDRKTLKRVRQELAQNEEKKKLEAKKKVFEEKKKQLEERKERLDEDIVLIELEKIVKQQEENSVALRETISAKPKTMTTNVVVHSELADDSSPLLPLDHDNDAQIDAVSETCFQGRDAEKQNTATDSDVLDWDNL